MSNHLDLIEIRKVIEGMTPAECWQVQENSMADAGMHWKVHYGNLLGAILIYCSNAAHVMGVVETLSEEEAKELQALGALVEQKWKRGQRGEQDPAELEQKESELDGGN